MGVRYRLLPLGVWAAVACGASDDGNPNGGSSSASSGSSASSSGASSSSSASSASSSGAAPDAATDVCARPKPGPNNTGVPSGTPLKKSGSIKVTTAGSVVEDLDIDGQIEVLADNVTIRRVRITSADYYPIRYDDPRRGLVVEDSEIIGTSDDVTAAISFAHYTARRLNVHGGADGLKANEDVLIEDTWIHDLRNGQDQHNDAVQSTGGKGVTIRHSVLSGASNAAVQTGDEGVATEDLRIECSWLSGGGYTLNIRGKGATVPKNTVIVNNRFGRDFGYGPITIDDPKPTFTGNVFDDDGSPVPPP